MTPAPPRRRRPWPLALLESLVALAVLVALVGGVPAALLRLSEWPITGLPTGEQIKELPTTAVSDEALFGVLTVVAWLVWGVFVCSVVVEVGARLTGRRRARVNIGGPLQQLAARLVSSVLLSVGVVMPTLLGTGAGMASAREAAAEVVLPTEANVAQRITIAAPRPTPAPVLPVQAAGPRAGDEVVIERGDHFWGVAKSTLTESWGRAPSDGEMVGYWLDLVETNYDRLQPPEHPDPDLIYPGQTMVLPAIPGDPSGPAPAPQPPPEPPASTPDPPLPSRPTPTSTPAPTTPTSTPPTSPTSTPPTSESDDESTPTTPTTDPDDESGGLPPGGDDGGPTEDPENPGEGPDPTDDPGGEDPDEEGPGQAPSPTDRRPGEEAGGSDTTLDEEPAGDKGGSPLPLGLVAGGAAVAGALLMLERRRRIQQRHLVRGRRIKLPPPEQVRAEQVFRQGADVDAAHLVDVALRAAAGRSEASGLPGLRWVEETDSAVTLVLSAPIAPPAGFEWEGRDRWVSTASAGELAALAANMEVPAPALVPLGTTVDDATVLIDLEGFGVTEVHGTAEQTTGIVRSVALAAATSPWAAGTGVWLVGLTGEMTGQDWVTTVPTLSEALDAAEAQIDRVTEALRGLRCQTTREARAVSANPQTWAPLIVVSAVPAADADEQRRLDRLADRIDCGVGVVVPGPPQPGGPARRLTMGVDGWLRVTGVDPEIRPHQLGRDDVDLVVDLLDVAAYQESVPEAAEERPARRPQPRPSVSAPAAADDEEGSLEGLLAEVDAIVRVLGEVEVVRRVGGSWDAPEKVTVPRQKALEVLTYLAMRDTAVDREDLEISLFPDGTSAPKTVYNLISVARTALGDDMFPVSEGGRYGLTDRVVTDYAIFYELTAQADEAPDPATKAALLAESLDLVTGEPFTGLGRGFAWVGPLRGMIVAQVIDAAEALATLHLASGDWRAAEWAARKGLQAFPVDERMYRVLMRTASASGSVSGVQRVFRELTQVIADPDGGVAPDDGVHQETLDLLAELTGQPAPSSSRPAAS